MRTLWAFTAALLFSFLTVEASAAEALIRRGGSFIDRFVLQNTTDPAFEGYIVIVVASTEHKIVYQVGPANDETFTAFCNRNDPDDTTCNIFDPDPVYEEWDLATQVPDGDLTPANRRKFLWAWIYQVHVKKAVAEVEEWLTTLSGLSPAASRRVLSGAYLGWGLDADDATDCAALTVDQDLICTYSETGLIHVTGRIKRLVEDLDKAVLDLP